MIYDKFVEILEDFLSIQSTEITQDTSFKDDLALDSLDLYELVVILEEEFNVEIPQEKLSEEVSTVEDMIRILKELGVED